MSAHVIEAPPKRRQDIRRMAELVRQLSQRHLSTKGPYLNIIKVLEHFLPAIDPEFYLQILTKEEMGSNHGVTIPARKVIILREDVYDGACAGHGRDRLTAAHEVGHYLMHDDLSFARTMRADEIPLYRNAEWQANCFAGELLICRKEAAYCTDAQEVARLFGVSHDAANHYWRRRLKN